MRSPNDVHLRIMRMVEEIEQEKREKMEKSSLEISMEPGKYFPKLECSCVLNSTGLYVVLKMKHVLEPLGILTLNEALDLLSVLTETVDAKKARSIAGRLARLPGFDDVSTSDITIKLNKYRVLKDKYNSDRDMIINIISHPMLKQHGGDLVQFNCIRLESGFNSRFVFFASDVIECLKTIQIVEIEKNI